MTLIGLVFVRLHYDNVTDSRDFFGNFRQVASSELVQFVDLVVLEGGKIDVVFKDV